MLIHVLQVDERSYDAEPLSHHHSYCQVLLPASGRIALACGGERGWVGGEQVAAIPAGAEHLYHADGPNRIVVADFPSTYLESTRVSWSSGVFRAQDARLINLTATLRAEARTGGLSDPLVADALLRYLIAALSTSTGPDLVPGTARAHRQVVAAAETFLQEHFRQPLTAVNVAEAVGISPSHLHRVFRAETGETLVKRVQRLRVEAAAKLLRETDQTVLSVAHEVGFASQSHLTRVFTLHIGCAPGQYRRQHWKSM